MTDRIVVLTEDEHRVATAMTAMGHDPAHQTAYSKLVLASTMDEVVERLTERLHLEWAGPYIARVSDFNAEEIEAGKLREADREAEAKARAEARRILKAALFPTDPPSPSGEPTA